MKARGPVDRAVDVALGGEMHDDVRAIVGEGVRPMAASSQMSALRKRKRGLAAIAARESRLPA